MRFFTETAFEQSGNTRSTTRFASKDGLQSRGTELLVLRSHTPTNAQGLIACSISTRTAGVWATDTAKFVVATTQNWVGVNWLKGSRYL